MTKDSLMAVGYMSLHFPGPPDTYPDLWLAGLALCFLEGGLSSVAGDVGLEYGPGLASLFLVGCTQNEKYLSLKS